MINVFKKIRLYNFKTLLHYAIAELKRISYYQLLKNSYSQKGEDLIIDKLLNYKREGLYIDVGASDPNRFSNTKRFYKRGWHGINIEPNPDKFSKFIKKRPRDINLNLGIANTDQRLSFYMFIPNNVSTFSKKEAESSKKRGYILEKVIQVQVRKLENIFAEYVMDKEVDFISIDTEGLDLEVLKSNNYTLFKKPKIICIESLDRTYDILEQNRLLIKMGYKKVFDNGLNSIFLLDNNI